MILRNLGYPAISTIIFVIAIVVAHIFAPSNYDWTRNTISDLGAQGYNRKWIMQVGFLAFGVVLVVGLLLNGLAWRKAPILIYGLCVALTGIFCTQPFFEVDGYSSVESSLHSAFAQIAGVSFSIGILVQVFFESNPRLKLIHLAFFVSVIGLSAAFGLLSNHQGILQRLLYLVSFAWLILCYKA